ncbi:MAG: AmmeMemoRadiSam system protein B [Chloroflexota bacterium]|nr:MAG: AmmeMemoRadiSam system protein B [Chloroflexota bacterium]
MRDKPKLRALDFQPVIYENQQMWLARDPLELTDYQLILSPALAQMLIFCDGHHSTLEIQSNFEQQFGLSIDIETIEDTLARLDAAYLLDNDRSRAALREQIIAYRDEPYRPAALAGKGYPADPAELDQTFREYGSGDDLNGWQPWYGRGVISPHIDYFRGGPVYSQVWRRAEAAAREADLVLIFGTDHNGSPGSITLTRKPYATPYGILPNDPDLIDALANAYGPGSFEQELHHQREHSVELSAVWLHHVCGDDPPPMVPILCGSFHDFVMNGLHPADDPRLNTFVETLRLETAGKKILAVASVDLAHVGPSFGDDFAMDSDRRARLFQSDEALMASIGRGDDGGFYAQVAAVQDRDRICGFSSIYLMLRYLGQTEGIQIAYDQCPADAENTSLVSICGMLLS